MAPTSSVLDLLAKLVSIPSVNPAYDGGVPEKDCAEFVENYFCNHGIETWRQDVFPQRFNVLARIPGQDRSKRMVFEAHMDTVSIQGMTIPPFQPTIRDGKLFGRGACDTKGGMAAMMQAMINLKQEGIAPPCDIIFVSVVDEEYSYRGVVSLCQSLESQAIGQKTTGGPLQAELAVVAEPTDLKLVVASKGVLRWRIETIGMAAHSSKPHLGKNAIVAMARVIHLLETDSLTLSKRSHPLLGCATMNIGVIQGGVQVNFVPDRCQIEIDRRLLPGETWEAVFADYDRLLDSLRMSQPDISIVMHPPMLTDYPLDCNPSSAIIRQVAQGLESMGLDATAVGVPFGSDASKFAAQGIPSIILGPGSIDQAHASVEYVDCAQVQKAVQIYGNMMRMKVT
jgi:acetylornithine deacetylase